MRLRHLSAMLCLALALAGPAGAGCVALVQADRDGAMVEAAEAFRERLRTLAPGQELRMLEGSQVEGSALDACELVVSLGSRPARAVAALPRRPPALFTLLPQAQHADILAALPPGAPASSAIFLDQPPQRQIAAIRLALPGWTRIALLAGPASTALADQLASQARAQGFEVVRANARQENDLYPALREVLANPAVLVALPDSSLYASHTLQNVLLTAYRNRSPMTGFSPAYVRAGALLGLYATPHQLGEEAAEAAVRALREPALPPPRHTRRFNIAINSQVARSMGIAAPAEDDVRRRLEEEEERP